jgi:bifunctional non-homologous end joining protein LigD
MQGRPLTLIRLPYGVKGRSFYQRHWKAIPEFVDTARSSDEEHLFCNNLASLIWFAQNRVLEFHTWTTRLDQAFSDYGGRLEDTELTRPDYLVIDIDVHSTAADTIDCEAFKRAREAAFLLRDECQKIQLKPFVKTSGRSGLHIFIPVQTNLDFAVARVLANTICTFTARQKPDFLSVEMQPNKRGDRVLLDSSPNGRKSTVCTVYSARANFQAGVSAPICWDELADCSPNDFTIHSMLERSSSKGDLWGDIFHHRCDLRAMMNLASDLV